MIIVSRERIAQNHLDYYSDSLEAREAYHAAARKERIVIEDTDTGECIRLNTRQVLQVVASLLHSCYYRPETIFREQKRQRAAHDEYICSYFYNKDGTPKNGVTGPIPIPTFDYDTGEVK